MQYRRCGNSGLLLPMISLGLWHNFGHTNDFNNARQILRTAFDNGITHFDLANNYGPPYGAAEDNFGRLFNKDFKNYRMNWSFPQKLDGICGQDLTAIMVQENT